MIFHLCSTSRTAKKNGQDLGPHKASAKHHPNSEFSPLNYSLFASNLEVGLNQKNVKQESEMLSNHFQKIFVIGWSNEIIPFGSD